MPRFITLTALFKTFNVVLIITTSLTTLHYRLPPSFHYPGKRKLETLIVYKGAKTPTAPELKSAKRTLNIKSGVSLLLPSMCAHHVLIMSFLVT